MADRPPISRTACLAALLAGDRTEQEVAESLGITLPTKGSVEWVTRPLDLCNAFGSLICDGLIFMRVVDGEWHYFPTQRARRDAPAEAVVTRG